MLNMVNRIERKQFPLLLSEEEKSAIASYAYLRGMSMSEAIRKIVVAVAQEGNDDLLYRPKP